MDSNKLGIPGAIIIAGLIIGGTVLYSGSQKGGQVAAVNPPAAETGFKPEAIRPIDDNDHLRGAADPKVIILEYSDLECPFCKQFHQTLEQVMKDYGNDVAWVYRHFPLPMHSKAQKEAEATECVAELGGEAKFWEYTDKVFATTPSNNGLDEAMLPKLAVELGIDEARFNDCLASGRHATKVKKDSDNAVAAGGRGTPFSLIATPNGEIKELGGSVPPEQLKAQIDALLKK
jgi:protein-disulfide isomerase